LKLNLKSNRDLFNRIFLIQIASPNVFKSSLGLAHHYSIASRGKINLNLGNYLGLLVSPPGFCYAYVTSFIFFFNDRLEQGDLRNYNTDLHQIFRDGRHVGVDVQSGMVSRLVNGRCHRNQF